MQIQPPLLQLQLLLLIHSDSPPLQSVSSTVELGLGKSGSYSETETTRQYTHSGNNDYTWAKPDPFLHFQIRPSTRGIRLDGCKIPLRKQIQGVILAAKDRALEKKPQWAKRDSGGGGGGGGDGEGGGGHGGGETD